MYTVNVHWEKVTGLPNQKSIYDITLIISKINQEFRRAMPEGVVAEGL